MVKTITDPQIIGSRGEAFVSERANSMGFMYSRYGPLEAGIDGLLEIRDTKTGTATGRLVATQVKTTETGSYTAESDSGFEYLMTEEDVVYWRGCNLPVIVILVHLERGEAYWKSVDAAEGPANRRLCIDKNADNFDAAARDAIADLCIAKSGFGVWFPTLKTGESGHLNMLRVILPERIFVAASPFKTGRKALEELLVSDQRPAHDWVIRGGQFMSFHDPRESALKTIVDVGAVEEFDTEEVAYPDDEPDEHAFIDLLRRTLSEQLDGVLAYSRDQRAFHFPAVPKTIERTYKYKSLKKATSADVVKKYEKGGKLKFVRHHAFEPRFWRIGDEWFLSVSPTFVFTWDGFRPDRFASSRLAGKKQLERNSSVLGQFVMWRHLLITLGDAVTGPLLERLDDRKKHFLHFAVLDNLDLPRGVPDDIWRPSETKPIDSDDQGRLLV